MRSLKIKNGLDRARGKEKAATKILIGSGWTAQKFCDRLKDRCFTSASRSVKPEEIRRRAFATDPV